MSLADLVRTHLKALPSGATPPAEPDARATQPTIQRSSRPACPVWVCSAGRKIWRRLVPELERLGVLDALDADTLATYCQVSAEIIELTRAIELNGWTMTFESGARQIAPEVTARAQLLARQLMLANQLALTPKSRAQILYSSYGGRPLATPGPNRPNRRGAYRKKAGAS